MAFRRKSLHRELEFTSLIDVVFLLLIFFLVSFGLSVVGQDSDDESTVSVQVPETRVELPVAQDEVLENLMIQIVPDSSKDANSRRVYVLWPAFGDTAKISRRDAFQRAIMDSTFATYTEDFLSVPDERFRELPPSRLISRAIKQFIELDQFYNRNKRSLIEVTAERNTKFRILGFIMEECSSYLDTVPQLIIRTRASG